LIDHTLEARASSNKPGFFLSLDGPDGGGKTTQAAWLADWLRQKGFEVVTCRDPGATPLGDQLRRILLDRETANLSLRAEMLLYMASRAQLVEEVIRPALNDGKIVISDRFLLANIVYQGYAGGLPTSEIGQVGLTATGHLLPDLTLVLDIPIELARSRVGGARDRIEDRPSDYQARVREGFRKAAERAAQGGSPDYPAPVTLIDASVAPELVRSRLQSEVEGVLALRSRT